jgi:hypothetical protein
MLNWKEYVEGNSKVLSWNIPVRSEENHEILQGGRLPGQYLNLEFLGCN